jgi:hypothetical protein
VVETGELVAQKRVFVRSPEHGIPDNLVREYKAMQVSVCVCCCHAAELYSARACAYQTIMHH